MTDDYKTFTLITGASSGLGECFARICAAEGRNLILVARHGQKLHKLAQEIGQGITVHVIVQDLSEHGSPQKIYRKIRRLHIIVDQLINNAGIGDYSPQYRADMTRQEQILNVNITALTALTGLLLPEMVKRGQGRILNVGSVASFVPVPNMAVYAASKAYVLAFSEAIRLELRETGVTVTCLCPGPTKTSFARAAHLPTTHPVSRSRVSARSVARYGYQAMNAGTAIAIPGFRNKLTIMLIKILPRFVLHKLIVYSRY